MFVTQASQLSALNMIERAHVELMNHKDTMEYAGVIMVGKYKVSEDVPTAMTNGVDCIYGDEFIRKLSESDRRGLIMHENLHKTFQHTFLWKHLYEKNAKIANQACDYVINIIIKDLDTKSSGFVTLPQGGLYDERFRGMSSQEVFDILMDEREEGGSGGNGDGEGEDGEEGAGLDGHDWTELPKEKQDEIKKEIDQAIRQGALMAGKLGGNLSRELGELLQPKVDWREQLRDYVTSLADGKDISTWQRVNRRWLQHDVYMPSTLSETIGRIVVGIDTSGSIGGEELNKFLSEVQSICMTVKPDIVDLIYWDTEVAKHEIYDREKQDKLVQSTKPAGGGGTDPSCVPAYIEANKLNPECVIMLTDGYVGTWGTWKHPLVWCIVGGNKATPTVGASIYVD
jgi:predicted metal-dependent peptidase